MSKATRLILTILATTTAIIVALAGTASARNFSVSNQGIRATWSAFEYIEPLGQILRCRLTLEGTLHSRTIVKGTYNLIGNITRAEVRENECAGGSATIRRETLPWNVRYQGFEARLPEIRKIFVLISGFTIRIGGSFGNCEFTSRETLTEHLRMTLNRETVTGVLASGELGGTILSNEGCAFGSRIRITFRGTSSTLTLLGTETTRITVTLI